MLCSLGIFLFLQNPLKILLIREKLNIFNYYFKIIQNFWNDTYYTDQNACTSPRIIFWTGEKKTEAKP